MSIVLKLKNNKILLFTVLILFIILELLSVSYIEYIKGKAIKFVQERSTLDFKTHIKITDDYLGDLTKIFYDKVINNAEVQSIMYQATQTQDKQKLKLLRDKFYNKYLSDYNYMKAYGVRQLHFHLPNALSFLRFHRPNKFGDSLIGIRPSLEYVNKYKKYIHIFEEGRIFNGFRNVYPLYYKNIFVGTVEISYSFSALKKKMLEVEDSSLIFLISSNVVKKKVFKSEQQNYEKCEFEGYLYDKSTFKDDGELSSKVIRLINTNIAPQVVLKLEKGESFSLRYRSKELFGQKELMISFMPIYNLKHKKIAYLVHYSFDNIAKVLIEKYKILFLSLTLFSFLLSLGVGFILRNAQIKEKKEHEKAIYDSLTKIYNRYGLDEVLANEIDSSMHSKQSISAIFFDIDHFKVVNDTYGHAKGDYILEELSKLVSSKLRASDIFARWGGEEFIIFLKTTSLQNAMKIAEKLRLSIEEHDFEGVKITSSFGVVELQENEDKEALLDRVDTLLYEAKESGRNRVIS